MPQLSYDLLMDKGSEGLLADCGFKNTLSPTAFEDIPVGRGVVHLAQEGMMVRLPAQNLATIVFDADLVTSNEIDGEINGVAIATVTFTSDHDATMALIAAAIEAADSDVTATVGGANNRTLTVTSVAGSVALVSDWVVTLGSSQAGVTETNTSSDAFYGVAMRSQSKENLYGNTGSAGAAPYYAGEAVSMLTKGRIYVKVEDAVDADDLVYMRTVPASATELAGQFRGTAVSNQTVQVTSARWIVGASAGELAVLEINQP